MRFLLDEGVPVAVGRVLVEAGFEVIAFRDAVVPSSPDTVVADAAMANNAVLVAIDRDMKEIAKAWGVGKKRYRQLGLLSFRCREVEAISRIAVVLPFIKLQLQLTEGTLGRRMFVEVHTSLIRIVDP